MTTDKKKLRELAGAAMPGPWEFVEIKDDKDQSYRVTCPSKADYGVHGSGWNDDSKYSLFHDKHYYPSAPNAKDAAFIAAANPQAVIELLDEIDMLRSTLKPFAHSLVNAEMAISQSVSGINRSSHVVRTTTYWLSYADFERAVKAVHPLRSNPDDAEACSHIWEHLHGTDKNNEYRCRKCGSRKP